MTYYHVTFARRVGKIRRDGIQPGRSRVWRNPLGGKLGNPRCIYAWSDYTTAVRWAGKQQWDFDGRPTAVVTFEDDETWTPEAIQLFGAGAVWREGCVPPTAITAVKIIEPDDIREAYRASTKRTALVVLTPYTARGEAGCPIVTTAERVEACTAENLVHWTDLGFVWLTVDDYTPTRAFGDNRSKR